MFFAANRSKRSLALDLKDERGKEALLRLVDGADVFAQSMRAGTAERQGLGAAALRARNERLVYCSIGAFGRTGPLADQPGYDPLMQAFAGLISITGEAERPGRAHRRIGRSTSAPASGPRSESSRRCTSARPPAAAARWTSPCSTPPSRWSPTS